MDKSYNDNIKPLLDVVEKIIPLLKGTTIKIPRIASCGMQSHGKSSTLESITHISLPKGEGTVTICPIKICLRNTKEEEFARIKFEIDPLEKYERIELEEISEKIKEYQNKVKKENNIGEKEVKLFDKVIQVEVNRKNAPNLTLYDMPGLNFKKEIREKSEEINEKYLKEKETTVLLVISGSEEVNNSYATEFMKKIPDYNKRFNAIITKADTLKNRDINIYLDEIKSLNLENPPSLLVNKFKEYENLSYEEMEKKEKELINQIPNINQYPDINKGVQALIKQLIEIQRKDLLETFSDISLKVRGEIENNEKLLKSLPSLCKSQREFFIFLEECIKLFKEKIELRKGTLECKEDGSPKANLLKYDIQLKFRKHIKNVKNKINEILTLPFCNQITNNIVQFNSDNIPILEDEVAFNLLLKPKIKEILSDFIPTINDIFDYMKNNIKPIINESFGKVGFLAKKVYKLYSNYSDKQKEKMIDFYNEIEFLETENVHSFGGDTINKVNTMNKHINFFLFGKNKKKNIKLKSLIKMIPPLNKINNEIIEPIKEVIEPIKEIISDNNKSIREEDDFQSVKSENEIKEELKENKTDNNKTLNEKNIIKSEETKEENKIFKTINDLTEEIISNPNYGEAVKEKFKKHCELIKSLIDVNYNYENEKKNRLYDSDEFAGRIKIAYRPQDIQTFYERIINPEFIKIDEDNGKEFIPGIQYIDKNKLLEFQKLITRDEIQIKTANVITKMISYLEVMLNRDLDMIFLSIKKYIYDRLTDDQMISYIRNELHLLKFEKCRKLIEIRPDDNKKRTEYEDKIKNLKKALKEIDNLKVKNNILLETGEGGEEEEEEEEEDKNDENNEENDEKKLNNYSNNTKS